jgi:hypothetical protein
MDAQSKANRALAEIRRCDSLYHLRRRPRCVDGSLNLNSRVNRSFHKVARVSDYYDPYDPTIDIDEAMIK